MGLIPAITSAHPGMVIDNSIYLYNRILYDPLIFNLSKSGVIKPFFSLGIERTPFEDATSLVVTLGSAKLLLLLTPTNGSERQWSRFPRFQPQSQEIRRRNGHWKLEALFIYGARYDLWNHTKSSGIRKLRRNSPRLSINFPFRWFRFSLRT
jgi:hypothetical protein